MSVTNRDLAELFTQILQGQAKIMTALSDLQAAVAAEETEEAAILTYLQGVPALITAAVAAAPGDGTALETLATQIGADTAKLAAGLSVAPPEGSTASVAPSSLTAKV